MMTEQIIDYMDTGQYVVNEEATKAAVEKFLRRAREYKVTEYIPEETRMVAVYSDMPSSRTGTISDPTSRVAIRNVEEPERRRHHIERAEQAVDRLGEKQRRLIKLRYLDEDSVMDLEVAEELGYSDRHYRRIKADAFSRLAKILGLLVIEENKS